MSRKIVTQFVYPPVPYRGADWQAHYDGDEPNDDGQMPVGHGSTEAEAIADLQENYPDEPTDLEMLEIDYEQARDRYLNALRENRHEPAR